MSKTIVILLIILIIQSLVRMARVSNFSTKDSVIEFYKRKIQYEIESKSSNNTRSIACLIVLITDIAIIYLSIQSVFQFIK